MKFGTIGHKKTKLPVSIAIYPLESVLILPGGYLSLNVIEPRYVQLIEDALCGDRIIGVTQLLPNQLAIEKKQIYDIGSLARIVSFLEKDDGHLKISLQGVCRFRCIREIFSDKPYRYFQIEPNKDDFFDEKDDAAVYKDALLDTFYEYFDANHLEADWETIIQVPMKTLINGLSAHAPFNTLERQALLEAPSLKNRAEILIALAERFFLAQNGLQAVDLQ